MGSLFIVVAILVLFIVILVHELGHYLVARWCGIPVHEFLLDFGPRLWSLRRGGTIYSIRWLPLGGFVRFLGVAQFENTQPDLPHGQEVHAYRKVDGQLDAIYFHKLDAAEKRASRKQSVGGTIQDVAIQEQLTLTLVPVEEPARTYPLILGAEVHREGKPPVFHIVPPRQRFDQQGKVARLLTFLARPVFNLLFILPLCVLLICMGKQRTISGGAGRIRKFSPSGPYMAR